MGLEVAETSDLSIQKLQSAHYQRIANHVKIYQSYSLINTSFFIAHGNYVSLYDIISKKWKKTFSFDVKVMKVFRNEKNDVDYNIGLYLNNNRVRVIDTDDVTNSDGWEIKEMSQVTKGTPILYVSEQEHYRMTYVLSDDNGTINLYGFARGTLFILNGLVKDL